MAAGPMTAGARVYHVGPWRRWSLWIILGPIILGLLALAATGDRAEVRPLIFTAFAVLLIGLPFQLVIDRARVELSPGGVRLKQTGYQLVADWSAIIDVRLEPGRQGFVTRESMAGSGAGTLSAFRHVRIGGAPLYAEDQRTLLAERRFIPIEAFAWHLTHGDMSETIARFAPHLAPAFSGDHGLSSN